MSASDADFQKAVLVPSHQELQLNTVPLAVAAFPNRVGNAVMRTLGTVSPLPDFRHLKRVRKAPDDDMLETILCVLDASTYTFDADSCTTSSTPQDLEPTCLPASLQALYTNHSGIRLRLLHGAAMPPQTRQQWEAWTKLWPITWRIPDHGAPVTEETPVDVRTQRYFEHHMRAALQLAARAGVDNAALIVNPPALTPVAEAPDGSRMHPLHHAVMVAIQVSSERDLAQWPPSATGLPCDDSNNPSSARGAEKGCAAGDGGGEPLREVEGAEARPEQVSEHLMEEGHGEQERGNIAARMCSSIEAAEGVEEVAHKRPRLDTGAQESSILAVSASRPYMCTGYDCFVVREPCIMCAMALVHSRIQRVIYCQPDAAHGGLGGCRRLHACKSLNHSYEVYRMELKH